MIEWLIKKSQEFDDWFNNIFFPREPNIEPSLIVQNESSVSRKDESRTQQHSLSFEKTMKKNDSFDNHPHQIELNKSSDPGINNENYRDTPFERNKLTQYLREFIPNLSKNEDKWNMIGITNDGNLAFGLLGTDISKSLDLSELRQLKLYKDSGYLTNSYLGEKTIFDLFDAASLRKNPSKIADKYEQFSGNVFNPKEVNADQINDNYFRKIKSSNIIEVSGDNNNCAIRALLLGSNKNYSLEKNKNILEEHVTTIRNNLEFAFEGKIPEQLSLQQESLYRTYLIEQINELSDVNIKILIFEPDQTKENDYILSEILPLKSSQEPTEIYISTVGTHYNLLTEHPEKLVNNDALNLKTFELHKNSSTQPNCKVGLVI
jgi:hypothetical protein